MQYESSIADQLRQAIRRLEREIAGLDEQKRAKRKELQQHKTALRVLSPDAEKPPPV